MATTLISFLVLSSLCIPSYAVEYGAIPRALAWSLKTHGPDSPWHAISVEIGSPSQKVDLFPGGFWQSNILSSSICQTSKQRPCLAQSAGLYDTSASSSPLTLPETGNVDDTTFDDKGILSLFGSADYVFDVMSIETEDPPSAQVSLENFDMFVISEGSWTLPGGSNYPIQVGTLSLGAPEVNQSWNHNGGQFNSSLLPSALYLADQVPSNSFGLHIGSTGMLIPPSLYIGGYDQTRVLGQVTVQDYNMHYFPIDLLDIGMGVVAGSSPFSTPNPSGLLARGNSSMGVSTQVIIDPISPYLYLPASTCEAITSYLPVKYQADLGLYFWDTSSPKYRQIIASSSFLSFTFRLNSSVTQNITINVPFSLLNLTLDTPLVSTPTQYFPCTSFDVGQSYGLPTLGKAFLQAAFLGVNWGLDGNGAWFLAQAPGPNTPSQAVAKAIALNDYFVTPSENTWVDTWKGSWTDIASETNGAALSQTDEGSSGQSSGKKSALSGAAIGGIAAGVILLGVMLLAAAFILWRRRKASVTALPKGENSWGSKELDAVAEKRPVNELDPDAYARPELSANRNPVEMLA